MFFITSSIAVLLISSAPVFGQYIDGPVLDNLQPPPATSAGVKNIKIYQNVTKVITANIGDSVQFECYASGTPSPTIRWRQFSGLISQDNILKFPSVEREDHGKYNCDAISANSFATETYELLVKSEPLIKETVQKQVIDNYTLLKCTALLYPKSTFKWYKNGELLKIEDKDEIDYRSPFLENLVTSSLDISMKNKDWKGSYKCEIENEVGKDEKVFKIDDLSALGK